MPRKQLSPDRLKASGKGIVTALGGALVAGLVGVLTKEIPKDWLTDNLAWALAIVAALVLLGSVLWLAPDWVNKHPLFLGVAVATVLFGPPVAVPVISEFAADRAIGIEFGVRRVSGPAGAQHDFSPIVQARPGDVLEFEVTAAIRSVKAQKEAGVSFTIPKVPRPGQPVRADYLVKPDQFGNRDTVAVRPAKGLVHLSAPITMVARSEYPGSGDPVPPQPRFVSQYRLASDSVDEFFILVQPSFLPRIETHRNLVIRFRVRVSEG
jgi:hypothetical protein